MYMANGAHPKGWAPFVVVCGYSSMLMKGTVRSESSVE